MKLTKDMLLSLPLNDSLVGIRYLGQEGFLFSHGGHHLGVDLYLSDYVDQNCCQLVQWQRLYAPPVAAEELDFLDVVLCTHGHYDHADPDTLSRLSKNPNTKFVIPAPETAILTAAGVKEENIIAAVAFEKITVSGFEIIPIPAAHETLSPNEDGLYSAMGYVIRVGGKTFFHAGDMCMYDGLIESLVPYQVDVAMLPINGRDYFRNRDDIIGNFNCEEAVLLAKAIGADMLVPMHHDLYAVNRVRTAHFVDAVETLDPFRKYHIFAPGELYIKE